MRLERAGQLHQPGVRNSVREVDDVADRQPHVVFGNVRPSLQQSAAAVWRRHAVEMNRHADRQSPPGPTRSSRRRRWRIYSGMRGSSRARLPKCGSSLARRSTEESRPISSATTARASRMPANCLHLFSGRPLRWCMTGPRTSFSRAIYRVSCRRARVAFAALCGKVFRSGP